jgi:hypothetical protein
MNLKKGRIWAAFLLLIIFGAALYFPILPNQPSIDVPAILKNLSEEDRESLEWLFLGLHQATCSYVLFGDKPMSICSFLSSEPCYSYNDQFYDFIDFSINKLRLPHLRMTKEWELWEKYKASFPSSNFILLKNDDSGEITLVMINKSAFLKTVQENIDAFKVVLGDEINPDIFLDLCIKSKNIFRDVLKYHDELLGILLGYGKHNAFLFSRRHQIAGIRKSQMLSLSQKPPVPSKGFATLEEEYHEIDSRLSFFNDDDIKDLNFLLMGLPMFVADENHPETQELKKKYKNQYKTIVSQYKSGNFLEVTLNQFVNGDRPSKPLPRK